MASVLTIAEMQRQVQVLSDRAAAIVRADPLLRDPTTRGELFSLRDEIGALIARIKRENHVV